jgi:hypothetical protein
VDSQAKKPTKAAPKGTTKPAYNWNNTVLAYQVMDNKAVSVVDNHYPYSLVEMEPVA